MSRRCCYIVMTDNWLTNGRQCQVTASWAIYPMDAPSHMWTESCQEHVGEMLAGSDKGFMVYPLEDR